MVADYVFGPAGGGAWNAAGHPKVGIRRCAIDGDGLPPQVACLGDAAGLVGFLRCVGFRPPRGLFSFACGDAGSADSGVFRCVICVERDAGEVAAVLNCAHEVAVMFALDQRDCVAVGSAFEVGPSASKRPGDGDAERTLAVPPEMGPVTQLPVRRSKQ
jgi:hypothetical protein